MDGRIEEQRSQIYEHSTRDMLVVAETVWKRRRRRRHRLSFAAGVKETDCFFLAVLKWMRRNWRPKSKPKQESLGSNEFGIDATQHAEHKTSSLARTIECLSDQLLARRVQNLGQIDCLDLTWRKTRSMAMRLYFS
ncbi:uncharacterized protein LOC114310682 isoform X2 [Camellia sinensis]|uniref:uncharacterized protein LOC114310682 isoform X2 n=1 Tax=Camellia sinensis TaxID=4442 RepID=UPI001035BF93|nr:uncharacterized protein LOC114310682 isoform X2 [Camellia sinensis]